MSSNLLLGLAGQRGVVLEEGSQGEVCGGQLPGHTVPDQRVAPSGGQSLHGTQVVVYSL